jgi:hypothetical protein
VCVCVDVLVGGWVGGCAPSNMPNCNLRNVGMCVCMYAEASGDCHDQNVCACVCFCSFKYADVQ